MSDNKDTLDSLESLKNALTDIEERLDNVNTSKNLCSLYVGSDVWMDNGLSPNCPDRYVNIYRGQPNCPSRGPSIDRFFSPSDGNHRERGFFNSSDGRSRERCVFNYSDGPNRGPSSVKDGRNGYEESVGENDCQDCDEHDHSDENDDQYDDGEEYDAYNLEDYYGDNDFQYDGKYGYDAWCDEEHDPYVDGYYSDGYVCNMPDDGDY